MINIIRSDKKSKGGFTCISNDILQSKTLKAAEIGVLVYLLSLPADFVITKTTIWRQMKIGRDQFNKAWEQLARLGYIQTFKYRGDSSKSKFYYRHVINEIPILSENKTESTHEVNPRTLETSDWKTVPIQSNNTNTSESVSNHRHEVTVRHGQNEKDQILLDQKLLEPKTNVEEPSIVPHPQLRFGSVRDNEEDQMITTPTEESTGGFGHTFSMEVPSAGRKLFASEKQPWIQEKTISGNSTDYWPDEIEPDETDINNFKDALDDLFKEKFPNWKSLLKKKQLHLFLQETAMVHGGMPELIEMVRIIKLSMK